MDRLKILEHLKKSPIEFAWVIEYLEKWQEGSATFATESPRGLSFVHRSGHPSQRGAQTFILSDKGGELDPLLSNLPETGFTIRETSSDLLPKLKNYISGAQVYYEQRMDVTRESFKPFSSELVRRLVETDALALTHFQGAPPQALENMKNWIRGATILGIFENDQLISMGSTFNKSRDAWNIVSIRTLPAFQRKGFARYVTSALVHLALEQTKTVSLTVLKDNSAAISCYDQLGFVPAGDRIWINKGTHSKP